MKLIASFDLDSVLYPFLEEMGKFLDIDFDFDVWDLGLGRDRMKRELRRFSAAGGFQYGTPLINPCKIEQLQDAGVMVIYCTARREEERADTQIWLNSYGMKGPLIMSDWKGIPTTMYSHQEYVFFGLDDKPSNVQDMLAAGMHGYLHTYPFSEQFRKDNPEILTVNSATEFCDIVGTAATGVSW